MTFEEAWDRVPGEGWLSPDEGRLLWDAVRAAAGPTLEVGCYRGRSTVLLHLAAPDRPLYCVDPFAGFNDQDPTGDATKRQWAHNVRLLTGVDPDVVGAAFLGLNSVPRSGAKITLWPQRVEDWRPRPVGLAYLDGYHTFEGTREQIRVAMECGARTVLVHDVNDQGEGREVLRACWQLLGPWVARVERLAVWPLPPFPA